MPEPPPHFAVDWLDAHGDKLYSYALARVGGDACAAEDLVQESLLAAIKAYDRFEGDAAVETWLISILRRKIIDRYRASSRRAALPLDEAFACEHGRAVVPWSQSACQRLESAEFREAFDDCLGELNPLLAEAFTLCVLDGLSTEETCNLLGVTPTNLSVRLHRARVTLRKLLQDRWFLEK